jgi:hypothetical protein
MEHTAGGPDTELDATNVLLSKVEVQLADFDVAAVASRVARVAWR